MNQPIYTIGHSTHTVEVMTHLLKRHGITAITDVRSQPYSKVNPQFNRETLLPVLKELGIGYVFLGRELGARSEDSSCYVNGRVQYDRLARSERFQQGLQRVIEGMDTYRIALMCAEKDPLRCHRAILIARHLVARNVEIQHILGSGQLESHEAMIARLLGEVGYPESDLFRSGDEIIAEAYRRRAQEIAYVDSDHRTMNTTKELH
jgi:uncharacterized protein (DUF488 family)